MLILFITNLAWHFLPPWRRCMEKVFTILRRWGRWFSLLSLARKDEISFFLSIMLSYFHTPVFSSSSASKMVTLSGNGNSIETGNSIWECWRLVRFVTHLWIWNFSRLVWDMSGWSATDVSSPISCFISLIFYITLKGHLFIYFIFLPCSKINASANLGKICSYVLCHKVLLG